MAATHQETAQAGVELFLSDPHGEYETVSHVVRSACGAIRARIDALFPELDEGERAELATLVYYPRRKTALEVERAADPDAWRATALQHLCALFSSVAQSRDPERVEAFVSDREFLSRIAGAQRKTMEALDAAQAEALIRSLAHGVRHLSVDAVHILGDIYDRGPAPELIMDELAETPGVDVVWGNHDIVWMGAALGEPGCITHVVRTCARYANLDVLTDAYGIDLSALLDFAQRAYAEDPCVGFALKGGPEGNPQLSAEEYDLTVKVQKATSILQFKVEAKLIDDNPEFGLADRKLLHLIDRDNGTVVVDGVEYPITDPVFPTIDWDDPYALTPEEAAVMDGLSAAFRSCERLQRHIRFMLDEGSLYSIAGDNLLYHACVPLNADGSLKEVMLHGRMLKGRALFDAVDQGIREAFDGVDEARRKRGRDLLWYLWLGEGSPLFAKSKMATFEIHYIADKAAREEVKNPYYSLLENPAVLAGIFQDFGMDPECSRVISGHTPIKVKDGEDPVKCAGHALIIDGGFSGAYRKTTGIAGFVLVEDAQGCELCALEPFCGTDEAIRTDADIAFAARTL